VVAVAVLDGDLDFFLEAHRVLEVVDVAGLVAAALTGPQDCVSVARCAYEERRNILVEGLNAVGWPMEKPPATMFVWAKIPENYTSSEQFVKDLLDRSGVLVTPGSAFGQEGEGYVRLALVQDEDAMRDAVRLIDDCGILKA
jgi:LL-diaminopimelate aminotransferase